MEARKKSPVGAEAGPYVPRKLTLVENVILTAKVLGILGLIGATLWGISLWTQPQ